ncbi:MAG: hypothetical protein JWO36_1813 [Myxococcales bacterium]|nr:hypothetical protein [Myxococcales bacterium]
MRDQELAPPPEAHILITLQDGRVLDECLHRFEHLLECEHVVFEPWQVDEVFSQPPT